MTVYPCAKINLGLNVVNRRVDGYHDLETVFFPVALYDELTVSPSTEDMDGGSCFLQLEGLEVDCDPQKNLVVKAYNALTAIYHLPSVQVKLAKRIPLQAGMGGGSADCAYMIRALNELFGLGMTAQDMQSAAARLGADCAFFINPIPSYAEGIGEKLSPVQLSLSGYKLVIVKPDVAVSTREAFACITPRRPVECCRNIIEKPLSEWKGSLVNDFEPSVISLHPVIGDIKRRLYGLGAHYAAMSGSGSALFGLFSSVPDNINKVFNGCFTAVVDADETIK